MKIYKENDPVLHKKSEIVPESYFGNNGFLQYTKEMYDFMKKSGGIGLAAPQIGDNKRIFVMGQLFTKYYCINPVVTEYSEKTGFYKEGCLSFPGLQLNIERPKSVKVSYYDPDGCLKEEELSGIWARCFQHELDHINGIVFLEHVGPTKLKMAKSKIKKNLKKR